MTDHVRLGRISALSVVLTLAASAIAIAQQLTQGEIEKAIQAGQGRSLGDLVFTCSTGAALQEPVTPTEKPFGYQYVGAYRVEVSTSAGRIALASRDAKQRRQPFGLADVTAEMLRPGLHVVATPEDPFLANQTYEVDRHDPIYGVVLRMKRKGLADAVLEPESSRSGLATFPRTPLPAGMTEADWVSLQGGQIKATSWHAVFSREKVTSFSSGDLDAVVLTKMGNQHCKITASTRAKLLR